MGRIFRPKRYSYYLGEQRPILGIDTAFVADTPLPSPTPTPTPTITPTNTPTTTPTNTPTTTPTNTPTTTSTPTPTPSVGDLFYEGTRCGDLFSPLFILKSTTALTFGSGVSVLGDDTNCYLVGSATIGPLFDYEVVQEYVDCDTCIPFVPTPTPTPTSTLTPTPTPSAPSFDPDAQAFFTSVIGGGDTLTPTEETAVNQLVVDLKGYGLWGVFDAMYPFVGSTSTSTKWNLLNPLDTDGAFRITWQGGMAFNSLGILNDNTGGGNTYLNPQTLSYTGMTMGVYINQGFIPNPNGDYDMGGFDGSNDFMITLGFTNKTTKYVNYNASGYKTTSSGVYDSGLLLGQNDGTITQLYQDNTELISEAQVLGSCNQSIGIGCSWRGFAADPSFRGYSVAFIGGTALNPTQIANLNTSITTFNTTLGR